MILSVKVDKKYKSMKDGIFEAVELAISNNLTASEIISVLEDLEVVNILNFNNTRELLCAKQILYSIITCISMSTERYRKEMIVVRLENIVNQEICGICKM